MPEVLFSSKTCLKARLSTKTQYRGLAEQYRGWAKTQYRSWAETQNRGSAAPQCEKPAAFHSRATHLLARLRFAAR